MSPEPTLLDALRATLGFAAHGAAAGNLTVGRGELDGRAVRVALVENRFASGALGALEAEGLVSLLAVAGAERAPLVLYLDSAGAKVSEGLKALGAFRRLYRAALDAAFAGAPIAAVLGRNCYGGSSMLAHLASRRLFSPATQLAMSGPAILAAAAGTSALDEAFRAIAQVALGTGSRAKASAANVEWQPGMDLAAWLRAALVPPPAARQEAHAALGRRLGALALAPAWEAVRRRDLDKLYAEGCEVREAHGVLDGRGRRGGGEEAILGLVGRQPLGAARAWLFADLAWKHVAQPPRRLEVFLDCASHAARLEDERVVLSEYIAGMSAALAAAAGAGSEVGLTIVGEAGGGVYVALAAPARRVASLHGADIQVLPGAAVAAILGERRETTPEFAAYREAGVADEEIKLGLLP